MAALLVAVLFLNIVIYLINTIGAKTIDNLIWLLYLSLPNKTSKAVQEQRVAKAAVLKLKGQMNATSSQDEFAKWAKLRRQHDKAMEDYEVKNKKLGEYKSTFDWRVKTGRWATTTGLKMFLQFWYSKSPMFNLPPGWFPWQVEWILSFPRAPMGTVSIQIWGGACSTVIPMIGNGIGAILVYFGVKSKPQEPTEKDEKAKVESAGGKENADTKKRQ
ncbi:GET complex subunit get1 [Myotisia sp. PD_48]|nr:GET complex subunit get1 [Myotisia sp. PD_48]